MQVWQVEHFFLHKKVPVVLYRYTFFYTKRLPVVLYRYLFVKKKVFNLSDLHFSEVTSYITHTLAASTMILSKDIDKYAFMCGSNFNETDVTIKLNQLQNNG